MLPYYGTSQMRWATFWIFSCFKKAARAKYSAFFLCFWKVQRLHLNSLKPSIHCPIFGCFWDNFPVMRQVWGSGRTNCVSCSIQGSQRRWCHDELLIRNLRSQENQTFNILVLANERIACWIGHTETENSFLWDFEITHDKKKIEVSYLFLATSSYCRIVQCTVR